MHPADSPLYQLLHTVCLGTWLALGLGCASGATPLPTQTAVAIANQEMARTDHPPLYQLLYDYALTPALQDQQQRVRIAIWLRHMDLSPYQLSALRTLSAQASVERQRIEEASAALRGTYEARITAIYDQLWEKLSAGAELTDPELNAAASDLTDARMEDQRQQELLALRLQGVRAVLDLERPWLATLNPRQEALLTDATFFLRHTLDPYANPGDFKALVGSIYVAGHWGTLTRGSYSPHTDHLNIGGLWTDQAIQDLQGPVFNDARRELILYMLLLEPTLIEAIDAIAAVKAPPGAPDTPPAFP